MAENIRPTLASVTIRRLTLPDGGDGTGLGDAIAAALTGEFAVGGVGPAPGRGVAQAIAREIARHPAIRVNAAPNHDGAIV
jgi:hypothetical protein